MKKFIILAIAIFVMMNVVSLTQPALASKVWDHVGANPTTTSRNAAVKAMTTLPNKAEVLKVIQTRFPDTVWVKRGTHLQEVSFGNATFMTDTWAMFDSSRALVWTFGNIRVLEFLECNNISWTWQQEIVASKPPVADTAKVIPPVMSAPTEKGSDFPEWVRDLLLMALVMLSILGVVAAIGIVFWIFRKAFAPRTPPAPHNPNPNDEVERNRQMRQQLAASDQALGQREAGLNQELDRIRSARGNPGGTSTGQQPPDGTSST